MRASQQETVWWTKSIITQSGKDLIGASLSEPHTSACGRIPKI